MNIGKHWPLLRQIFLQLISAIIGAMVIGFISGNVVENLFIDYKTQEDVVSIGILFLGFLGGICLGSVIGASLATKKLKLKGAYWQTAIAMFIFFTLCFTPINMILKGWIFILPPFITTFMINWHRLAKKW